MNDGFLFADLPFNSLKVPEKNFRERNPIWTECKAKLIERYLFYFVQITKSGTYMDAFAGPQETEKHDMWSAKLVMESKPRWLRNFFLFDVEPSQVEFLKAMRDAQPPRDKVKKEPKRRVEIYLGDFNAKLLEMLSQNPIPDKEATFCLLDQRTFECDWNSVKTLAQHKTGGNKIELFYFFPEGWINRSIHAIKYEKEEKLLRWWGTPNWQEVVNKQGVLRGLFVANRFKTELNYKYANPFPIYERKDAGGRIMYYMIHASDHAEAPTLMNRAYHKALDILEAPEQLDFLAGV